LYLSKSCLRFAALEHPHWCRQFMASTPDAAGWDYRNPRCPAMSTGALADAGQSCRLNSKRRSEGWFHAAIRLPLRPHDYSRSIPRPCRVYCPRTVWRLRHDASLAVEGCLMPILLNVPRFNRPSKHLVPDPRKAIHHRRSPAMDAIPH
jgi:hypothetical protein